MRRPLGLGLVGAGWFGALCVEAYGAMKEVSVVAIADADGERARAIAPAGTRTYATYEALLDDAGVELVAINTPPHLHAEMTVRAAECGRHVFVEKPLATTLADGLVAVDAVRRAGVHLGIDYVLRHHPLHRMVAEIVRAGPLGNLLHWSLENLASMERLGPEHWFWNVRLSGGIHVEHGVHFFDLCNRLADGPPTAVCGGAQRRQDGRVDRTSATVTYGNGLVAELYHAFVRTDETERTTIRMALERGHIAVDGWIPTRLTVEGLVSGAEEAELRRLLGGAMEVVDPGTGPAAPTQPGDVIGPRRFLRGTASRVDRWADYRAAVQSGMRQLVSAIRGGAPPDVTPDDALLSLQLACLATEGGSHAVAPLPGA